MLTTVALILGAVFIICFVIALNQQKKKANLEQAIRDEGFSASHLLSSHEKALAFDQAGKRLALALPAGDGAQVLIFAESDITGVDVERDEGASITRKTGLLKFTTESSLQTLVLSITLSDSRCPAIRMLLYKFDKNSQPSLNETQRVQAVELANVWLTLLSSVVRAARILEQPLPQVRDGVESLSGELLSLHQLHQSGALSSEEFAQAKARLLKTG